MLTSVLTTSLGLFARKSIDLISLDGLAEMKGILT
jgi:hypothetical protein